MKPLVGLELRLERDVVLARQRARQIAELLGFDTQDQTRIATAVSEIARNAFQYAAGGRVEFLLDANRSFGRPAHGGGGDASLVIRITDSGPGLPGGASALDHRPARNGGVGILGARRLMDHFEIDSSPGKGTTVVLAKTLHRNQAAALTAGALGRLQDQLAQLRAQDPLEELRHQNLELVATLAELEQRQLQLGQLNRELEDTNRGVVALYAELDEKADSLRRASEMKSTFLSNMSHEFRTPLNSILSLSRILLDRMDGELSAEQEKQVTFIRNAASNLLDLVNDLLDLAKVEAGKVVIRPQQFEVSSLFGALRGLLRPLLAHNGSVALTFDDCVGVPPLHTDEGKVSQILRNFISNALKFTERGEVRVSAEAVPPDRVTFRVADTGIGIAPGDREVIFLEYTQLDSPRQRRHKGTGLGLPLARRLAELLGGRVVVESEVGVGSTFSLTLPCVYQGASEVSYAPEVNPQADPTRLPVLVVEDNRETLFIYEKYLKGTGFQVIPARSVRAAQRALEQIDPVAVILDILLEGEHAWDLISKLKADERRRSIPLWVVSMVDNEAKARMLGADDFCSKPVERAWLLSRLEVVARAHPLESVLIVDDDEASRYLLRGLLADTRYQVLEAADGAEGLRLAREQLPAVVFLDLDLPQLGGREVLAALRSAERTRGVSVIIHTARVLEEAECEQLSRCGAVVLPKAPLARDVALAQLREALNRVRTPSQPGGARV